MKTIKRDLRNKKNCNKNFADLPLRISELGNSKNHYENEIFVLKDRIKEVNALKNHILLKRQRIKQNFKKMKNNWVRWDFCKIDIHRVSYGRNLKSKKLLEKMWEKKAVLPWKNPMKRIERKN